jgi:chromosome segregation ATPase
MQVLVKERTEKDGALAVIQEKFKILEVERSKDQRQITTLQTQNENLKKQLDDVNSKFQTSEVELQRLRRESENVSRQSKQSEQETHSRDLRLNRSIDELERLKALMATRESEFSDKIDAGKRIAQDLFMENKRLQMQKNDLINGFKKQSQLVEILKKQKGSRHLTFRCT